MIIYLEAINNEYIIVIKVISGESGFIAYHLLEIGAKKYNYEHNGG